LESKLEFQADTEELKKDKSTRIEKSNIEIDFQSGSGN
jgi:hypothetical protein